MSKQFPPKDAFEKLLLWLDPNRDRAGEKYEKIRSRLITIFSCRGGYEAEDLADSTINVVCSKIDGLIKNYIGDPALYFYGVAKKIYLENEKQKHRKHLPPPAPDLSDLEQRCQCLEQCMKQHLSREECDLIMKYQEKEKREKIRARKQMAAELGISINALRLRVFHIHSQLRSCIEQCLRQLLDS